MNTKFRFRSLVAGLALLCASMLVLTPLAAAQDEPENDDSKTQDSIDYASLKNPIPFTKKSIARGKQYFTRYCTSCHGPDGKAEIDLISDATNLTDPNLWRNGKTEGEIFKSIKEGAGEAMPPFKIQIRKDDEIWNLVNFIQSLWPEDLRPELVSNSGGETGGADHTSD